MPTVALNDKITFALSVADRAASAQWYVDHMGFELMFSSDEAGWTELATKTPGVTLGLGDAEKPNPGNAVPVFGIEDLDTGRAALEQKGVRFDGETVTYPGMVKLATLFDPDDNALMLAQDLSSGG